MRRILLSIVAAMLLMGPVAISQASASCCNGSACCKGGACCK
jgi:hypothetical protein